MLNIPFDNGFLEKSITAKFAFLASVVFGLIVFLDSWNCDDAYHSYVMARNLVEGNGFVYNAGYRVNASTCPLFTLLAALLYLLISEPYLIGIILGTLFSSSAAYVIFRYICRQRSDVCLTLFLFVTCYSFFTFTTSGLENSLLYFLVAGILATVLRKELFCQFDLFFVSLLTSLLAFTRLDSVLIVIPLTAYVFLTCSASFLRKSILVLLGFVPFLLWECFSVIYYGFPFPNTAYAKLYTGFPLIDYISRGMNYLSFSCLSDLVLLVTLLTSVIATIRCCNVKSYLITSGVLLYVLYVIYIGGDFMAGRHLSVVFLASVVNLLCFANLKVLSRPIHAFCFVTLIFAYIICRNFINANLFYTTDLQCHTRSSITDEKRVYQKYNIIEYLLNYQRITNNRRNGVKNLASKIETYQGRKLFLDEFVPGQLAYDLQKEYGNIYVYDVIGLADELRSRLPAFKQNNWRVGHMWRTIPEGYHESLLTGENRLSDPSLKAFYDVLHSVVSGDDLFAPERISNIFRLNSAEFSETLKNFQPDQLTSLGRKSFGKCE